MLLFIGALKYSFPLLDIILLDFSSLYFVANVKFDLWVFRKMSPYNKLYSLISSNWLEVLVRLCAYQDFYLFKIDWNYCDLICLKNQRDFFVIVIGNAPIFYFTPIYILSLIICPFFIDFSKIILLIFFNLIRFEFLTDL